MCENCIDTVDDVIVELDNAIVDGMPQNDHDSPMLFEDYREPLVSTSKAILIDMEEILASAQDKNFEKLALAASSCVSSLSVMKEAVMNACSTLPKEKQPQLLSPVKSIAMKAQDQIYSGMLVVGLCPFPQFFFCFFLLYLILFIFLFSLQRKPEARQR